MFSVPEYTVTDIAEVLLMPGLAVFFGLLAYFLGEFNDQLKGGKAWKWVGIVILAMGALSGFRYFLAMVSSSDEAKYYQSMVFQRRLIYSHWAAFWFPLVCLAIVLVISYWRKKNRRILLDDF